MPIKSGKRWARHVVRVGEKRNSCRVLVDKPEDKKQFRILSIGGSKILECYLT